MSVALNLKLKQIITVSLISFILLTPTLIVYAEIWQWHLDFLNAQSVSNNANQFVSEISLLATSTSCEMGIERSDWTQQRSTLNLLTQNFLFTLCLIPLAVVLGILLQKTYRLYRAYIFRQQVQRLERLWQQNMQS